MAKKRKYGLRERGIERPCITWSEIQQRIAAAGVKPDDQVFNIDIGPGDIEVFVDRDEYGFLEISSDPILIAEGK